MDILSHRKIFIYFVFQIFVSVVTIICMIGFLDAGEDNSDRVAKVLPIFQVVK